MKKLFSLLCVAMFAVAASAQITWNVKGGVGFATCYGDVEGGMENHFVGKIGVGIEKPLSSNWSLMPSLELAWKGAEYSEDLGEVYDGYSESTKETLDVFYIQVPIVAAYRINLNDSWNLTLKAGPYFAYAISGRFKGSSSYGGGNEGGSWDEDLFKSYEGEEAGKRFDAGLDLGVDFEFHRFVFGAEYELGLLKFAPGGGDVKNAAAYVTLGYKF